MNSVEKTSTGSTFLRGADEYLSPSKLSAKQELAPTPRADELRDRAKQTFLAAHQGLNMVEATVRDALVSEAEPLREIAHYLLGLGGKRIRPILAVLVGRLLGMDTPDKRLVDAAAGIELIHMATLLHDDIIDESPLRRHQETAYRRFGLPATLLTGDFLWVRAFGLCAHLGEFIVKATERACVELTEGEVLEGTLTAESEPSLERYRMIVGKKTASLFELAAAVGGKIAGANQHDLDALMTFGRQAGIAFQMVDDILDITSSEDLLGKPAGTDLKQRTPSLINILWLASGEQAAREFFAKAQPTAEEAKKAAHYLAGSKIVDDARKHAEQAASAAKAALRSLESPNQNPVIREHLEALIDYTLERCL